MLSRVLAGWGAAPRLAVPAILWMAALLGALTWLDRSGDGAFLIPSPSPPPRWRNALDRHDKGRKP